MGTLNEIYCICMYIRNIFIKESTYFNRHFRGKTYGTSKIIYCLFCSGSLNNDNF
jgi:hypothetical protein